MWDEAEPLIREALSIREKVEPDAWTTFNTQSMLGGALRGQKKYAESEPLLLAGYEGLKQRETTIPPQGSTRLPEAHERLVQLYTDWHAAEPDKDYDAKAAEWQKKLDEHNAALAAEKPASIPTSHISAAVVGSHDVHVLRLDSDHSFSGSVMFLACPIAFLLVTCSTPQQAMPQGFRLIGKH